PPPSVSGTGGGARCRCVASARLAVHGVLAVARAVLLQLEPVGVVPTVLAGDVVALLGLDARQRDLRTDIGLLGHGVALLALCRAGGGWCRTGCTRGRVRVERRTCRTGSGGRT